MCRGQLIANVGVSSGCYDILSFFFNDTATTEIYTLSLHDALPIFVLLDVFPKPMMIDFFASP